MGLKCSLLGHAFDETTTEEDRTESGNEVVHVERTIETCSRCGETRVVSENKEVTAIETGETGEATPDAPAESEVSEPPAESGPTTDTSMGGTDFEPPTSAAEDDGIILDDEGEESGESDERSPGEWPEDDAGPDADDEDAEIMTDETDDRAPDESDDAVDLGPDDEESGPATTVPAGTYRCPECGFTTDAEGASLRAGDYCPECHSGSLEQAGNR